jgi:hypothetical protein
VFDVAEYLPVQTTLNSKVRKFNYGKEGYRLDPVADSGWCR